MAIVQVEECDGLVTISIRGRFDFSAYVEFSACYKWRPKTSRYVIDFKHVRCIDSSALTMMLLLRGHTRNRKQNVVITNCNDDIRETLSSLKFHSLFDLQ